MGWELLLLGVFNSLVISAQNLDVTQDQSIGYSRVYRNTRPEGQDTDKTVEQLLSWLQERYKKSSRKVRQENLSRTYLPATTTQQPRPFQTPDQGGYTYTQGYPTGPNNNGGRYYSTVPSTNFQNTQGFDKPSSGYPSSPGQTAGYPASTGYQQPGSPGYQGNNGYSTTKGSPSSTGYQQSTPNYPQQTDYPGSSKFPQQTYPSSPGYQQEGGGRGGQPTGGYPRQPQPPRPPFSENPTSVGDISRPGYATDVPGSPSYTRYPTGSDQTPQPGDTGPPEGGSSNSLDDLNHPPHIHSIDVQCSKDMMTITIEFNRVFDGVIYSKGYYNLPSCRYVLPNSGRTRYTFTVGLESCGTQFIDEFDQGRPAYLENVLVLQNEPGIQEVWDTVRSVRCLWEGSISKALSVALSVGSLQQEVVTFSGDTASARLDIQMGRGPYAPTANGLVKIGETMTLVVTVEGDPGFSVLVRDCWATDGVPDSGNRLMLTDEGGCVLKPKLMGAWQEMRDEQAIRTYAFFQAFKFPDVMELMIECNVELCKAQCSPCQDGNQKYEPGVRRRRWLDNSTNVADPVKLGKRLHIYLPEELGVSTSQALTIPLTDSDHLCMSWNAFALSFSVLMSSLIVTSFTTVYFVLKSSRKY